MKQEDREDKVYINSKNIEYVIYLNNVQILEIGFRSGAVYHYYDVPISIYYRLVSMSEIRGMAGSFFYNNIRGFFQYQKVDI